MSDVIKAVAIVVLFFAIAAGGIGLSCRNYRECRRFGHSWIYCASSGGGR